MNGWDWIEEGERISAEAQRIAGLTEEVRTESIVFDEVSDFAGGIDDAKGAGDQAGQRPCREDGFCSAVYAENDRGGEARHVVGLLAKVLGVNLSPHPLDGNIWSPRNMMRVVESAQQLTGEYEALRKELHDKGKGEVKTVAALREALAHLGEGV